MINNKEKEIVEFCRLLEKLKLQEAYNTQIEPSEPEPLGEDGEDCKLWFIEGITGLPTYPPRVPKARSSTEAEKLSSLKEGSKVFYCKEARGKRRHYTKKGTVVKKDSISNGLKTHFNGGCLCYNRQDVFQGLEEVWINTNGIAKIIKLGKLSDMGIRVTQSPLSIEET